MIAKSSHRLRLMVAYGVGVVFGTLCLLRLIPRVGVAEASLLAVVIGSTVGVAVGAVLPWVAGFFRKSTPHEERKDFLDEFFRS